MKRGILLAALFCGCAGARPPDRAPGEARPVYERILGAQVASPELIVYLNPRVADAYFDDDAGDAGFARLVAAFERIGARRGEAAARLNWGAVLWNIGEEERAYDQMMRALRLFVRVGDVDGMAHAHEWIGYTLARSGAVEPAGDHLAVAYQLFSKLENRAAAERVANYGE